MPRHLRTFITILCNIWTLTIMGFPKYPREPSLIILGSSPFQVLLVHLTPTMYRIMNFNMNSSCEPLTSHLPLYMNPFWGKSERLWNLLKIHQLSIKLYRKHVSKRGNGLFSHNR